MLNLNESFISTPQKYLNFTNVYNCAKKSSKIATQAFSLWYDML